MTDLFLCTTLRRNDLDGDPADIDVILYFQCTSYSAGTRRTHPGGHWNGDGWDPPDDPEFEAEFLRAEFDGPEPSDAPGPLTEAETAGLRDWFEAHQDEALQAYLDQTPDDFGDEADRAYDRWKDEQMERGR